MTKIKVTYLATSTRGCPEKTYFCYVDDEHLSNFARMWDQQHPSLTLQKTEVISEVK